ncbi:lipase family protein [Sphaerospermopsis torques-reginae]|uniref:Lipase family protein n=1 Tax=Sphaerospermopsis torques-reginae ITEP-024 TaxID=984208 RepID=A0ABX8WUB5_9CYAN|nr:lipase family protein [Sphaerospermopsis torques-reginae]QYX30006.1 lipase family protein [Sphaerospermopsis torques-reginae ITEP-024]
MSNILTDEELELSLILAKISSLTYSQEFISENIENHTGVENGKVFYLQNDNKWGILVFLATYSKYSIISFKGTDTINDWKTNLQFFQRENGSEGNVHNGFYQAVNKNWEQLLKEIQKHQDKFNNKQNKEILLTGHSLGGALAIITASRLNSLAEFTGKIKGVYTYGAPRVGNKDFKQQYKPKHYRFEYGNDPVPSAPSLGFEHTGDKYYLPKNELTIQKNSQCTKAYQLHINVLGGIFKIGLATILPSTGNSIKHISKLFDDVRGYINDHDIERYIEHLQNYKYFLQLITGLENGSLKRYGNLIQDITTKKIVCYLLESKIFPIQDGLVYVNERFNEFQQDLTNLRGKIDLLYEDQLLKEVSKLKAAIETRCDFPTTPAPQTLQPVSEVRHFFSKKIHEITPSIKDILTAHTLFKAWAIATAVRGYILLEIGKIPKAVSVTQEEINNFRDTVTKWVDTFLYDKQCPYISTAYRFTAPIFGIERERVDRIAYISSQDRSLSQNEIEDKIIDVEVEVTMDYFSKKYDEKWIQEQIEIVGYLDNWSELLARLEGLLAFAQLCQDKEVNSSRDILPGDDATPGLYLIEM